MLIEGWRLAHRLWSVRLAFFWGAVSGLVAVWDAFAPAATGMPLWAYGLLSVLMNASIFVARCLKQPGMEE